MAHRWMSMGLAVAVAVLPALAGCAPPRASTEAEQTAHRTRANGSGYLKADDPDSIADLIEHYAQQNRGEVLNRETYLGDRPGGSVDVLFHVTNEGSGPEARECYSFRFRRPKNDVYVRDIEFVEIDCPET